MIVNNKQARLLGYALCHSDFSHIQLSLSYSLSVQDKIHLVYY